MLISDWTSDVCSSDLLIGLHLVTVFRTALYPAVRFFRLRTALAHLRAHHGYGNLRNVGSRLRKFGGYFDLGLNLFIRLRSRGILPRDGFRLDGRSEEHTSELQSLMRISYAVFCLKKKKPISEDEQIPNHTHELEKQQTHNYYTTSEMTSIMHN